MIILLEIGYFKTKYNQLTFPGYLSYKNEINIDDKPSFSKEYKMKTCISNEYEEGLHQIIMNQV